MLMSPIAYDLARLEVDKRLQEAARAALVAQLPSTPRHVTAVRVAAAARLSLATGLRSLAVRLDPTLACEPCLNIPSSR
jgi:hypothetical protein